MKIITLNTWGTYGPYQKRWDFFLKELETIDPDLLCLQEVVEPTLPEKIKKIFPLLYSIESYEAGLAILSRFPILLEEILKYKSVSLTEREDRRAIIARLKTGNNEMILANTHLSWKSEDEPTRLAQVKELIGVIKKRGQPALLAGDFNDVPQSSPIQEVKRAGYFDLLELLHPGEQKITWDNHNPFIQTHSVKFPDRQIDFLFLHQELLAQHPPQISEIVFNRPNTEGIFPSDHYGIFAEIG